MQKFELYLPTKIIFGAGTENSVAEYAKVFGATKTALIYGGQSAVKSGLIGRVEECFKTAGIEVLAQGGVVPNPRLSTALKMLENAKNFGADFVLAVGGGSVIDTAKAVAHGLANPETDIWDFWTGKKKIVRTTPLGVILTISAAGSEMSDSAVLTNDIDPEHHYKIGLGTDFNRPKFAILDPELTYTLPKWQISSGVADIFMHTDERYFCHKTGKGNHLSDEIAEGLMRDIIEFGKRGVDNPQDYEAMSEIMWCGSISHNNLTGLGNKGEGPRGGDFSVHQLGHSLSALYDATHGATLSAVWGSWARYVVADDYSRFAQLGRKVFGLTGTDDKELAEEAIRKVEEWFVSIGAPISLPQLLNKEVSDEEVEVLADNCSWGKTRTIGSLKTLAYEDMKAIYAAAAK